VRRGGAFWTHWFAIARRIFREALASATFNAFRAAVNHVALRSMPGSGRRGNL